MKDQIGTFIYFPSINFLKAGGGFGPIRVNNRPVTTIPFPKPEAEFDLLIGDWYLKSYKVISIFLHPDYDFSNLYKKNLNLYRIAYDFTASYRKLGP